MKITVANRLMGLDFLLQYRTAAANTPPSDPFLFDVDSVLALHFDMPSIQSIMIKNDPECLVLGYTQSMMGFLFFQPKPERIEMIGLGGGSLAKYCLRYLTDTHFTAIEINPKVIALRNKFSIPPDNERFKVICANGADYVRNRTEKVDVLLIDGFKLNGQPESLSSVDFYDNCYAKLNDGGVMVVNLLEDGSYYDTYTARILDSFKDQVLLVDAESRGNKIAFACKGDNFPPSLANIQKLVCALEPKHRLPVQNIAQKITLSIKETSKQS
ncbi:MULTISPECIES: spermine/spermidine synthase domain-containing protein [Methylobacter]